MSEFYLDLTLTNQERWRLQGGKRMPVCDKEPVEAEATEALTPELLDQPLFRVLLDATIEWLRLVCATSIGEPVWTSLQGLPGGEDMAGSRVEGLDPFERAHEITLRKGSAAPTAVLGPWSAGPDRIPQILFEVTRLFAPLRRKCDVAHWYYESVTRAAGLRLGSDVQHRVRQFAAILRDLKCKQERRTEPPRPTWEEVAVDKEYPPRLRSALLEVSHGLGMVRWEAGADDPGATPCAARPLHVVHAPDQNLLVAKLFGTKTGIPGFDDLFGGGLILRGVAAETPDPWTGRKPPGRGVLGVIRGRFGSGKSTLAAQLAFELARKGGVGVLLAVEQAIEEVLAQATHFGWLTPADPTFQLFADGRLYDEHGEPAAEGARRPRDAADAFAEALTRLPPADTNVKFAGPPRGLLYVHHPEDASLGAFEHTLDRLRGLEGFDRAPLRFVIVDPLDAVELTEDDAQAGRRSPQYLRNRTEQVLRDVTDAGFTLWLTTSDVDPDERESPYGFLPNVGDVVIRLSLIAAGQRHTADHIINPPSRLFEVEKARTQRFAKGVHPFEIDSRRGVQIYPSGDTFTRFVTWVDNRPAPKDVPVTLGHAALDLALSNRSPRAHGEPGGADGRELLIHGVRRRSVTTLMGPTGCAKTELALLYLLGEVRFDRAPEPRDGMLERSLFISFRDTRETIAEILKGPVGRQLKYNENDHRRRLDEAFDLLELSVGNVTGPWIFERVRRQFKEQKPGTRYTKVVIDNIAYMDLTSPLVRDDVLFVPNLLEILYRENVTPLFITSLVEGVTSESKVQTQIRDASHNLMVLRRNRYGTHHFIALQIRKSQQLVHMPQPLEVRVSQEPDALVAQPGQLDTRELVSRRALATWITRFLRGPGFAHLPLKPRSEDQLKILKSALRSPLEQPGSTRELFQRRFERAQQVHRAYEILCRMNGVLPWTQENAEEVKVAQPAAGAGPALDSDAKLAGLVEWRRLYRRIMDALEVQGGITIRLHTLDDYDRPMGEDKLERIGAARAPRVER